MGAAFTVPEDIANIACQQLGVRRINSLTDTSVQAKELNFCYDKLRQIELRRAPWRFATKRAMLRPMTSTSYRYIPPAWSSAGIAYVISNIVQDTLGIYWICAVAHTSSASNGPGSTQVGQPNNWQEYFGPVVADLWASATGSGSYNAGDIVYLAGPVFYICISNDITTTSPGSGTPWIALLVGTDQPLIALLSPFGPGITAGAGGSANPATGGKNRVAFPLPYGYLRVLDPDPRVEDTSTRSTTAALENLDWRFEGNFLISNSSTPILLRFVADVQDVKAMDPLFCGALGSRMGYDTCERITQSNIKKQALGLTYSKYVRDAQMANQLEIGNTEPMDEEEISLAKGPAGVTESEGPDVARVPANGG